MKLPSIDALLADARTSFLRFPGVILSGVSAAGFGMVLGIDEAWRLLGSALLGIPLFLALGLWSERVALSPGRHRALRALVAAMLVLVAWLSLSWKDPIAGVRFAQLALAAHLLVAVLPAWGLGGSLGFWQYNRILLLRFALASFFAAALFTGLTVALLAANRLLSMPLDDDLVLHLWLVMAFVFHPWFFLGGVPRDIDGLAERTDYPTVLKVFAQFVLIPLITVYLLILTAYLGRVVVTRTWPSGWIGWLVSSVAIVGILALLLVHPIRHRRENWWVDAYGRWFFVVLLPSIAMLHMALWQRIGQYGFTEKRYVLVALALWLTGIALFYGITGSRDIRVIPTTLLLTAALTFVGPLSVYSVSERSQLNRLERLLASNGMLEAERAVPPPGEVPEEDETEISAVLRYLHDTRGLEAAAPVLGPELVASLEPAVTSQEGLPAALAERLGIEYVTRWGQRSLERIQVGSRDALSVLELEGFDYLLHNVQDSATWDVGGHAVRLVLRPAEQVVDIRLDGAPWIQVDVSLLAERALAERTGMQAYVSLEPGDLAYEFLGSEGGARLLLANPAIVRDAGVWRLESLGGARLLIDLP